VSTYAEAFGVRANDMTCTSFLLPVFRIIEQDYAMAIAGVYTQVYPFLELIVGTKK